VNIYIYIYIYIYIQLCMASVSINLYIAYKFMFIVGFHSLQLWSLFVLECRLLFSLKIPYSIFRTIKRSILYTVWSFGIPQFITKCSVPYYSFTWFPDFWQLLENALEMRPTPRSDAIVWQNTEDLGSLCVYYICFK